MFRETVEAAVVPFFGKGIDDFQHLFPLLSHFYQFFTFIVRVNQTPYQAAAFQTFHYTGHSAFVNIDNTAQGILVTLAVAV